MNAPPLRDLRVNPRIPECDLRTVVRSDVMAGRVLWQDMSLAERLAYRRAYLGQYGRTLPDVQPST